MRFMLAAYSYGDSLELSGFKIRTALPSSARSTSPRPEGCSDELFLSSGGPAAKLELEERTMIKKVAKLLAAP